MTNDQEEKKKVLQQKIRLLEMTYQNFVTQMDKLTEEKNKTINKILKDIDQKKLSDTLKKIKGL